MTTDPESTNWPAGWQQTRDTTAGHPPPTVCRMVLFVDAFGQEWPAVVSKTDGTKVDLTVFPQPQPAYVADVTYDPSGAPGSWHWPGRV